MTTTRIATTLFVALAALGPLYTVAGYSPVVNVISELAAQHTPRNHVMAIGFVVLGAAVVVDGARAYRRSLLPFMVFGVAFGAAGLFGHKPIAADVPYVAWMHTVHGVLASLSGTALTVGFVWQAVAARAMGYRLIAAALAIVCVALPLLMLSLPDWQGLVQRVMYLLVFGWLWVVYPRRVVG